MKTTSNLFRLAILVGVSVIVAACSGNANYTSCLPGHSCSQSSTFTSAPAPNWGFSENPDAIRASQSGAFRGESSWRGLPAKPIPLAKDVVKTSKAKDPKKLNKLASRGVPKKALSTTILLNPPDMLPKGKGHLSTTRLLKPSKPQKLASVKPPRKPLPPKKPKKIPSAKRTDCADLPSQLVIKGC